jgi:hypothetical protein
LVARLLVWLVLLGLERVSCGEWVEGGVVVDVSGSHWASRRVDLLVCPFGWLFWLGAVFVR